MRRAALGAAALGALAGLAGGAAFGAAMADLGSLASVASLVRAHSATVGLAVHMLVAAVVGAGFGLFVAGRQSGAGETLFWGLTYGAVWWFLGPLTLLPSFTGRPLAWHLDAAQTEVPSLLGHLLYGAVTALALVVLRRIGGPGGSRLAPAGLVRGALAGTLASVGLATLIEAGLEPAAALAAPTGLPRGPATLVAGLVFGAGYALLYPDAPSGAGPGLVRGSAYGFAWWVIGRLTLVPVLSGAGLAWSLPAVRAGFSALPGLVLLGAATAVLRIWLDGAARALFTDDVRRLDEEGAGARGLRAVGRGVLAGLAGGLVFTALMLQIGYLPTVARLAGSRSIGAGLAVHLLIAQFIGASYGLLFRRRSYDVGSALGWGVSYGFFWWVLGALTLLPVLLGGSPRWDAEAVVATFPSLVGHIAYGAALGVAYFRLEARVSPWWVARTEADADRARLRRQETLTAAPALWSLIVLVALTVPLLVAG
ncbi:MAG: hypothetical protein ACRD2W_09820 [Acidimicrobiales bacterium]